MLFNSHIFIFAFLPFTWLIYFYLNKSRLTEMARAFLNRKHQNHNFDRYLYDALILNKKHGEIGGETVFEYIQNEK